MMEKRFRKLATAAEELPKPQRYGDEDATIGIIGWGSTEGTIQEAVDRARAKGYKVAALHPKILSPLPDRAIRDFIRSVKTVIVPECNYSGQLANLLGAKYGLQAIRVNKFGAFRLPLAKFCEQLRRLANRDANNCNSHSKRL